jgi:hypothetical protein
VPFLPSRVRSPCGFGTLTPSSGVLAEKPTREKEKGGRGEREEKTKRTFIIFVIKNERERKEREKIKGE